MENKRYTNFGHKYDIGGEIGEIIKIGMNMYIYILDKEVKRNFFRKMSLGLSEQLLYTKNSERINIIACGFFV